MNKLWTVADIPAQAGKRVLITGANSGIGYQTALKLARKGAQILLACRDRQKGEAALARLNQDAPGSQSELVILDLASLASVRDFTVNALPATSRCTFGIPNAGVMAPPRRLENGRRLRTPVRHQRAQPLRSHWPASAGPPTGCSRVPPRDHVSSRTHPSPTSGETSTSTTCNTNKATHP